jgi:hypothetical protein
MDKLGRDCARNYARSAYQLFLSKFPPHVGEVAKKKYHPPRIPIVLFSTRPSEEGAVSDLSNESVQYFTFLSQRRSAAYRATHYAHLLRRLLVFFWLRSAMSSANGRRIVGLQVARETH